uniref:Uncharacterized protein n=1 Tax=Physcomitrium patens TaxID=3218 RepID=A0A2K1JKX7_PHYPA|nr:hypothetical protein PHYPA_017031 [Physcomitrium patens]
MILFETRRRNGCHTLKSTSTARPSCFEEEDVRENSNFLLAGATNDAVGLRRHSKDIPLLRGSREEPFLAAHHGYSALLLLVVCVSPYEPPLPPHEAPPPFATYYAQI